MINGYVFDYLREMARHSVLDHLKSAENYGAYVAHHYDSTVRGMSMQSINARLIDDLAHISADSN